MQQKVRKQIAGYLAKKLLAIPTLQAALECLFMQTQLKLGSYIHGCTNETHSVANIQDLIPTLAAIIIGNTN